MDDTTELIVCLTTVAEPGDADRIASLLLERSAAACVQIDGPIQSHYVWEGRTCSDQEYRLMIKSSVRAWPKLKQLLIESHPYDEPQIIAIPVRDFSEGYGQWVIRQTR